MDPISIDYEKLLFFFPVFVFVTVVLLTFINNRSDQRRYAKKVDNPHTMTNKEYARLNDERIDRAVTCPRSNRSTTSTGAR